MNKVGRHFLGLLAARLSSWWSVFQMVSPRSRGESSSRFCIALQGFRYIPIQILSRMRVPGTLSLGLWAAFRLPSGVSEEQEAGILMQLI